jgi:hypothetical protein
MLGGRNEEFEKIIMGFVGSYLWMSWGKFIREVFSFS